MFKDAVEPQNPDVLYQNATVFFGSCTCFLHVVVVGNKSKCVVVSYDATRWFYEKMVLYILSVYYCSLGSFLSLLSLLSFCMYISCMASAATGKLSPVLKGVIHTAGEWVGSTQNGKEGYHVHTNIDEAWGK